LPETREAVRFSSLSEAHGGRQIDCANALPPLWHQDTKVSSQLGAVILRSASHRVGEVTPPVRREPVRDEGLPGMVVDGALEHDALARDAGDIHANL
jgi:hypothetical protein